jgi:hypothetical protein
MGKQDRDAVNPGAAFCVHEQEGAPMSSYRPLAMSVLSFVLTVGFPFAQTRTSEPVESIMARVAENQDHALELRSAYIYNQNVLIRFFRGNGKLAREEYREYTVTPGPKDTSKTLLSFRGKYERGGKYIEYTQPGYEYRDVDIDGALIGSLADDLTHDKGSRDGISVDLFPLTSKSQAGYRFALEGKEEYRGREVFRIGFKPASMDDEHVFEDTPWAGLILVDAQEYQPVMVTTHLAKGLPLFVKTVLGTNLRGLGFKISFEKQDDGLWFPVTYGGEFEVKAVFFYKRKMAIALRNSAFQHVRVDTRVTFGDSPGSGEAKQAP